MSSSSVISRIILLAACGSAVAVPAVNAFVTLGHGRLVGTTTVRADYDSNIFVSNREIDDLVGTLTGDVRYLRDAGIVTLDAGVGVTVLGFADHSELNTIDPAFDARLGYVPSDKTEGRATLSFRRNSMGNEVVNDRTESNDFAFDGSIQHLTTEKLGFRLTSTYLINRYFTAGYSNTHSYLLGAHGVYVYSPKLKLLSGVTTGESWTDSSTAGRREVSGRDWRYTVGAEGEFAPKVTGAVSVGYQHRDFDSAGLDDTGALYLSSRVSWAASEKTSVAVLVDQDFSVTAADQSGKTLSMSVLLNHQLREKVSLEASVGTDRASYVGVLRTGARKDRGYHARGRINYLLRDNASVDVAAGYRDNDSTVVVSDYDRFNIGVGLSLRF